MGKGREGKGIGGIGKGGCRGQPVDVAERGRPWRAAPLFRLRDRPSAIVVVQKYTPGILAGDVRDPFFHVVGILLQNFLYRQLSYDSYGYNA